MAIQDDLVYPGGSGNTPPDQGFPYKGGVGYDLNADFGNGADPRKAPFPGQTGEMVMRVDIDTSFTVGSGTPLMQFHAVVGEDSNPVVASTTDFVIIGSNAGPMNLDGTQIFSGYLASELVAGTSFFIRLNPWANVMSRCIANTSLELQDLRYLGLLLHQINSTGDGSTGAYFGAGLATMSLVMTSDISWNPSDFQYPSGVDIV